MAFDFPTSPAIGDVYTAHGVSFQWNGYGWGGGPLVANDTFLQKSGGTMTGDIVLAADPDNPMEAATKQYVDTGFSCFAHRSGAGNVGLGATTFQKVNLGTLTNQGAGAFTLSGGSLVIPKTGIYQISAQMLVQAPTTANIQIITGFSLNNGGAFVSSARIYHTVANNVSYGLMATRTISLTAGNTLELLGWASVTGCSALDASDGTNMSAILLSS